MKKNNHYKKEIEFEIGDEDNIDTLIKIADSPEGEELGIFSFQHSNGKVVTFDRGLNSFERKGEGLPEADNRLPQREFHFEFDVRFTLDESEDIELLIAAKDAGTHFKYMLKGLSAKQANAAVIDFEQQISNVIKDAIYFHASACYRKQDENTANRNESYKNIMSYLETCFKRLLKWKRDKVIEVREENGIKITTSIPIQSGANPQTKAEIEKEKQKFIKAVFDALELIGNGKKTQLDVGSIVFEKESDAKEKESNGEKDIDIPSRMKHALRKYNLNFKELLKEYKQKKADN